MYLHCRNFIQFITLNIYSTFKCNEQTKTKLMYIFGVITINCVCLLLSEFNRKTTLNLRDQLAERVEDMEEQVRNMTKSLQSRNSSVSEMYKDKIKTRSTVKVCIYAVFSFVPFLKASLCFVSVGEEKLVCWSRNNYEPN